MTIIISTITRVYATPTFCETQVALKEVLILYTTGLCSYEDFLHALM